MMKGDVFIILQCRNTGFVETTILFLKNGPVLKTSFHAKQVVMHSCVQQKCDQYPFYKKLPVFRDRGYSYQSR